MASLYAYAWLVRVAFLYDVNLETRNLHTSIYSWLISKILNSKFFFQWTVTFSTRTRAVYVHVATLYFVYSYFLLCISAAQILYSCMYLPIYYSNFC